MFWKKLESTSVCELGLSPMLPLSIVDPAVVLFPNEVLAEEVASIPENRVVVEETPESPIWLPLLMMLLCAAVDRFSDGCFGIPCAWPLNPSILLMLLLPLFGIMFSEDISGVLFPSLGVVGSLFIIVS